MREFFEIAFAIYAFYEYNRISNDLASAKKAITNLQNRVDRLTGNADNF